MFREFNGFNTVDVIEICYDIARFARSELPAYSVLHQHLSAFLHDNPCFAEMTRQRAISYWLCYYRHQHLSQDMYPRARSAVGTQQCQDDLTLRRADPTLATGRRTGTEDRAHVVCRVRLDDFVPGDGRH